MPATFAHGLIAKRAIDVLLDRGTNDFRGMLGENNSFVIMGAAGPDCPYLTHGVAELHQHGGAEIQRSFQEG